MQIYNLTQHTLTTDQQNDGLKELPTAIGQQVRELLNFDTKPTRSEIEHHAELLAALAEQAGADGVMLGGAPFLMPALTSSLRRHGIRTFFAFSQRRSTEVHTADGTVEKRCVFCYEGLIEVS